jgi:cleavage and polyadenylation specificity factor subunit 1
MLFGPHQFLPALLAWHRRYLKAAHGCLKGNPKRLEVTEAMKEAVEAAKAAPVQATHLAHPASAATLALAADASDTNMGAVLQQLEGRHWRPLAFFSQKFSAPQLKYSTFDTELTVFLQLLDIFVSCWRDDISAS